MMQAYERLYITIRYGCGHYAARPVFRTQKTEQHRKAYSNQNCQLCQQREARLPVDEPTGELAGDYYLVDGHKTHIFKQGMYWKGRYYVDRVALVKYFGKVDPRPELEVAI